MTNEQSWAIAVATLDTLRFGGHAPDKIPDPRLTLETLAKHSLSSCAPSESYSQHMPALPRSVGSDEHLPIDILFGSYSYRSRRILIYVRSIERYRRAFDCSFDDLLHIVRLHEFAHALVHLGMRVEHRDEVLYEVNTTGRTDWRKFLRARSAAFSSLDEGSHEFLAQALTYAGILVLPQPERSRLIDLFHRVELRQPDPYKLSSSVKDHLKDASWEIVLDAARGDADTYREPGFDLRTGLEELVCFTARRRSTDERPALDWTVPVDPSLSKSLASAMQVSDNSSSTDNNIQFLIDRFAGLKIEVFAREHPPPHFRVICGDETANYRIDDCFQINGGLRRHYKVVKEWYLENRTKLIDTWNRHRPSDCPVGAFRGS